MKIVNVVEVKRSPADVWHIVAKEFDQAHKWMGFVENSYAIEGSQKLEAVPVTGRVCEFTKKPNGLRARESVLRYSEEKMSFDFDVVPENAPKVFPVKKNIVTMSVKQKGKDVSEVSWTSNIELSTFGYLIYPLIRFNLSKSFAGVLKDLKTYMEADVR